MAGLHYSFILYIVIMNVFTLSIAFRINFVMKVFCFSSS
jgi:hypothetical protein